MIGPHIGSCTPLDETPDDVFHNICLKFLTASCLLYTSDAADEEEESEEDDDDRDRLRAGATFAVEADAPLAFSLFSARIVSFAAFMSLNFLQHCSSTLSNVSPSMNTF